MLELPRILCPVDFSDASRRALDHAIVIAGWYGSQITALHIHNPIDSDGAAVLFAEMSGRCSSPISGSRPELEARLDAWLAPAARGGGRDPNGVDETHKIADCISRMRDVATGRSIVMGTHGWAGSNGSCSVR